MIFQPAITLPKLNSEFTPEKVPKPKDGKAKVFQPPFFRGEKTVKLRGFVMSFCWDPQSDFPKLMEILQDFVQYHPGGYIPRRGGWGVFFSNIRARANRNPKRNVR